MRVLMLSLDKKILENGSAVQRRLMALAEKAGEITVFVPAAQNGRREVTPHLKVHGFSGGKIVQLWKMWRAGKKILNPSPHKNEVLPFTKGELNYDLITVQDVYFLGFLAVKLAEKFSLPLEVQVHGFEKMRGVREWLTGYVLRRADRIRVVSNRLREFLAKSYKLTANSLYVLPVCTQTGETGETGEKRERGRRGRGVPYPFTFLTVGRLVPVKNIPLQIRAFARLVKEYPQIRLRIVGDGPETPSLKLYAQRYTLHPSAVFEGEQKDVGRFYEEADAFLLTSDAEGWGLAALEAAAYKLPIIMTNVGLANEVLHHNKECVVVPVGDEEQLLGAMREVLEHPELRTRLGEAAFKTFRVLPSAEEQIRQQVEEWRGLQ